MGSKGKTLHGWKKLLGHGVYVNLVLPPAAPEGTNLPRRSVSAAHSSDQFNAIVKAFSALNSISTLFEPA